MLNREAKRNGSAPAPGRFGAPSGPDPREAGRRGGKASGVSRRLRPLLELEQGVAASKNGHAKFELLMVKLRQMDNLERAQIEADRRVRDARWRLQELNAQDEEMREERARLLAAREALHRRNERLQAAVQANALELVDRLKALSDDELDAVLSALDVLEPVPEEATEDAEVPAAP